MVTKFIQKIFGSRNQRLLKRYYKVVDVINQLEDDFKALSDEKLQAKTSEFKQRIEQGESLEKILPEAFATVREAGKRVLNMRHFDVQLIGGMVLHDGNISEMRTGEGKTLVATLAVYLNALPGKGVHVVTVNDYLAKRDSEWMGKLYKFLGLSTGVIVGGLEPLERQKAYAADITYGTNNEFGFDYLRDNMVFLKEHKVQRELNFAIVDEVDSILIDEARTPLIISGSLEENSQHYLTMNKLVPKLVQGKSKTEAEKQQEKDEAGDRHHIVEVDGDYEVDEKYKQVFLTEQGHQKVEQLLIEQGLLQQGESLYQTNNLGLMHHLTAALRAHALYQKDVDYVVKNKQVVIIDEFTGRAMPGRRWSEGLHQAIEAKEGVPIQNESQTLASITFQNYFRLYHKLAGMTGTADTEAAEFQQIYHLEVVLIPTHREMVRDDKTDLIYLTKKEKFDAIINDIQDCQKRQQPVLVGTASIETSEYLSNLLSKRKIKHQVLNAKQHAKEAKIVAQAGLPGAVTIATNMAGRGTDIVLGGNLEMELAEYKKADESKINQVKVAWEQRHQQVLESGGLHIIGTERHESRRIDNQLRGRAGRQGDPGSSRFYLSLEDNLMRIFASEKIAGIMQTLGMEEGEAIEHKLINKAIENAQKKVEGQNFEMRKQLLKYDDVANDQRKFVYGRRNQLMELEDISDTIKSIRETVVNEIVDEFIPPQSLEEQWKVPELEEALVNEFGLAFDIQGWLKQDDTLHEESLRKKILTEMEQQYEAKAKDFPPEIIRHIEKEIMLKVSDECWMAHLAAMDYLRQGIGWHALAQKNPEQEYKKLGFEMFQEMLAKIDHQVIQILSRIQLKNESDVEQLEEKQPNYRNMNYEHAESSAMDMATEKNPEMVEEKPTPFIRDGRKVGRNELCPCGSGKKYKHCCGQLA